MNLKELCRVSDSSIRANAKEILFESYQDVEDKESTSFEEWAESESELDPGFFYCFPDAENLIGDFEQG